LAVPVDAQTRLPRVSPSERNSRELNRRIRQDLRYLELEQQIQTESNKLRHSIQQERLFAPRPLPPIPRAACPRGSIIC
jgi:hypothetical protein